VAGRGFSRGIAAMRLNCTSARCGGNHRRTLALAVFSPRYGKLTGRLGVAWTVEVISQPNN
jgi:hypothetical protein